jgi:hypothetical protein
MILPPALPGARDRHSHRRQSKNASERRAMEWSLRNFLANAREGPLGAARKMVTAAPRPDVASTQRPSDCP